MHLAHNQIHICFFQKGGTGTSGTSVVYGLPRTFLSPIDCPLFRLHTNPTQKLLQMSRLVDEAWLLEVLDQPSQQFADQIAKLLADQMVCSTDQLLMLEEPKVRLVLLFSLLSHTFTPHSHSLPQNQNASRLLSGACMLAGFREIWFTSARCQTIIRCCVNSTQEAPYSR